MNNNPLVTILTDTKNRASLIPRCIESIQKQTYQNYEHIIADGGTDNTEEVVKSYNDPKIKYIKVPDGGPVAQTRASFDLSKGEFITFLDDDDEYLPEKIEKQLMLIQSLPRDYGFIYGSMTYYDNNTKEFLRTHHASISGGGGRIITTSCFSSNYLRNTNPNVQARGFRVYRWNLDCRHWK